MITALPSPEQAVWHLAFFPIRAYALCILAGIVLGLWWTGRRFATRGGSPAAALDIATWAVPFGIVGGRLYHVLSSPQAYFGPGGRPLDALKIWEGGLGIWGAVALGIWGAWIGCRRTGRWFLGFLDSAAPALALAQAVGRWGNWFNNELYGAPTDLPWALEIHPWDHAAGAAVRDASGAAVVAGTFHPTFLYESLWCMGVALALVAVERRTRLLPGQTMALYIMLYTAGRLWIEMLRIDDANHLLGLRLNVWTSLLVFAIGAVWWVVARRRVGASTPDADRPEVATAYQAPDDAGVDGPPGLADRRDLPQPAGDD